MTLDRRKIGLGLIALGRERSPAIGALSNYLVRTPATTAGRGATDEDSELYNAVQRYLKWPMMGPFGMGIIPPIGPPPIPGLLR